MEFKKLISTFSTKSACYFCLSPTDAVCCKQCELDFMKESPRCPICAKPHHAEAVCGKCIISPPLFSSTTVLFNYAYPAKKMVLDFKFNKRVELSTFFAELLLDRIKSKDKLPEALIPVPLHKKRQAQRGYNQSLELAKHLANKLDIPINASLCKRIVNTDPQSELPMKSRRKNVKNAFALNNDRMPKHIAIVDDVITTGSTINEISRLFKSAGCERIDIWAIART
jgi:ComF family protein